MHILDNYESWVQEVCKEPHDSQLFQALGWVYECFIKRESCVEVIDNIIHYET